MPAFGILMIAGAVLVVASLAVLMFRPSALWTVLIAAAGIAVVGGGCAMIGLWILAVPVWGTGVYLGWAWLKLTRKARKL